MNLWKKIQETNGIVYLAYGVAILIIGLLFWVLQGCGLFTPVRETAETVNRTMQAIDQDGSGAISMQEIIQYCLMGWVGGRATETVGKIGVKRIRNGRRRNDAASSESGNS